MRWLLALLLCASAHAQQVYKVQHSSDTDLFRDYSRISDLSVDFCVSERSIVETSGFIGLTHRNLVKGPVGYAVRIGYYAAPSLAALGPRTWGATPGQYRGIQWIPGAKSAGNIASIEHHYAEASLSSLVALPAGCYRFEVWGNSHSSTAPNTDGLIEVNGYPYPTNDTYGYMVLKTSKAD